MGVPSKLLLSIEAFRSMYEYGLGWMLNTPLQYLSPSGDGHSVMVIPGLGTADGSTHYVRNFLNGCGYETHSWGLGRNLGPRGGLDNLLNKIAIRVDDLYNSSGGKQVSIIGWSLGGIYAREVAKKCPNLIRQVITLGTPFKGEISTRTNATLLYELLSKDKSHKDPSLIKHLSDPPPVPFTSIYSKTDGVVDWECSIEDASPISENIEIPGASHLGLGHNPISMYIIANRLSYTRENWKPFWNE